MKEIPQVIRLFLFFFIIMTCSQSTQARTSKERIVVKWTELNRVDPTIQDTIRLSSDRYHILRAGIQNSRMAFEENKKGMVAFLGGSITYNSGWRDSVQLYLQKRFPRTTFTFIDAGIPSMGTTPGAFRLYRDVLSRGQIDLLFVEAAVNDETNGRSKEEQIRGMEGIIRHTRTSNPTSDIIMMHFVDPEKMKAYRSGIEPAVIQNHEQVASHYQVGSIHLAREVTDRIDNGEFTWETDFQDLHPSPFGQQIYARSIIRFLKHGYDSARQINGNIKNHFLPPYLDPESYDKGQLEEAAFNPKASGWQSVSSWKPIDQVGTRPNYTEVPMLISNSPGEKLTYTFTGNAVGIAIAAGPDTGVIRYRIDKGNWQELDLFTPWSHHLHLPWYHTLATGLEMKKHKLEIRVSQKKNESSIGHAVRIRYFYSNL